MKKGAFLFFIRALRLPFLTASVIPFIFGSLIERRHFNLAGFLLGLIAVCSSHLAANLLNDYADSKSGVDWQDRRFWGFFGGSKLIQEKIFSEGFYLKAAICFGLVALAAALLLAALLKNILVLPVFALVSFLGWAYSCPPLKLSYRRMGEIVIFLLFGPAVVMGGYFIQAKVFPDLKSFFLSLPFAFFITAVLFTNEVPDYPQDKEAGKFTWAGITGPDAAYLLYALLVLFGFISIIVLFAAEFLGPAALAASLFVYQAACAAKILRLYPEDKEKLVRASRLTIGLHTAVGLVLIVGVLWR